MKPKWSQEEVQQLLDQVKVFKDAGNKVDWESIGKNLGGRYASTCFNKHTQISEIEWTPEQEDRLGKWWEANNAGNFDIMEIVAKLDGHSKRGVQFKLERLTQDGKFNPMYRMGKDEMQKCE